MAKALVWKFEFPPIYGIFDNGNNIVYMFGQMHESSAEDLFTHETLHSVIQEVAGEEAGLAFDNVYNKIKKYTDA